MNNVEFIVTKYRTCHGKNPGYAKTKPVKYVSAELICEFPAQNTSDQEPLYILAFKAMPYLCAVYNYGHVCDSCHFALTHVAYIEITSEYIIGTITYYDESVLFVRTTQRKIKVYVIRQAKVR